jgi:tetratricopeptide (TPR) repeat protein
MQWWMIPLVVLIGALIGVLFTLVKKIPKLRMIDIDSMPEERGRKVKERIILERLDRLKSKKVGGAQKAIQGAGKEVSRHGRRLVQKLYRLEQYYQKLKKQTDDQASLSQEHIKKLMSEAQDLEKQEEYIPAEKKYIEIISHHPKCVEAYEGLGNMYLMDKKLEQARETLLFAARLDEKDASVQMRLAELEWEGGSLETALAYARKAVEIREKNPKYLDLYIQIALKSKHPKDARKGIKLLKEVNPENNKIEQFEQELDQIRTEYIATGGMEEGGE